MRSLLLLQLLGALASGANGFASHSVAVKPRLLGLGARGASNSNSNSAGGSDGAGGSKGGLFAAGSRYRRSDPSRQTPQLGDVMGSWWKLPSHPKPALSGASGSRDNARTNDQKRRPSRDDIRADILKLQLSNTELRKEVVALRTSMIQRGYTPVDDIFAVPKTPSTLGTSAGNNSQQQQQQKQSPASGNGAPKPPATSPRIPEEARLAALVALWGAAIALRGVFVPIAIGVGAARLLRWLDEGGTLAPRVWKRRWSLAGSRVQQWGLAGRRGGVWRREAVPSYVPVLARAPREDVGGVGDAGLVTGETLADAWDKMYPPRR
ncbi:unnamed protein product [Scytosiphon promiscuus]